MAGKSSPNPAAIADGRLRQLSEHVDVAGRVVLVFGAAQNPLAHLLAAEGAERVIAVETRSRRTEANVGPDGVEFTAWDGRGHLLDPESVDTIVSAGIFDRLRYPLEALAALYRVLRAEGQAWLQMPLYRGPGSIASRQNVPWPQLVLPSLDENERRKAGEPALPHWANRMSVATYVNTSVDVGFEIEWLHRATVNLEPLLDAYVRFEDVLSRYPALDLETNVLTLVLRKPSRPVECVPRLGYLERQRDFAARLERFKAQQQVSGLPISA